MIPALWNSVVLAQATAPASQGVGLVHMTPAGWAFMIISNVAVIWLTAWCFYKVLTRPEVIDHMQAPPELEPKDQP